MFDVLADLFFKLQVSQTQELRSAVSNACDDARRRQHHSLTPIHLLHSLAKQEAGRELIQNCGGNVDKMINELDTMLDTSFKSTSETVEYRVEASQSLKKIFRQADMHSCSCGKNTVGTGDVIAEMFLDDGDESAARVLVKQGISRLDVLNYISHGISKANMPNDAEQLEAIRIRGARLKVLLHNDDYSTMEFVVYALRTIFDKTAEDATRLMLGIHQQELVVVGVYDYDDAIEKAKKVRALAAKNGFPLLCSVQEEGETELAFTP